MKKYLLVIFVCGIVLSACGKEATISQAEPEPTPDPYTILPTF
jgi:hypothetical protein